MCRAETIVLVVQEKNNLEKEVAASCSMVSELLDILSEREKQKQKGATQQRGARDALLPTPTVVPGQRTKNYHKFPHSAGFYRI